MKYTSIHVFYLYTNTKLLIGYGSIPTYGFTLLYFAVYIYIFLLFSLFILFFIFDLKKFRTLNNLKVFSKHNFFSLTVVLLFLSLAGIPPLAGFVGKFLVFNFLFISQKYFYLFIFGCANFYSIYFYVQNIRFLISSSPIDYFLYKGYKAYFNKSLVLLLVLLNFINLFGFLYFEDFLYILMSISFYRVC